MSKFDFETKHRVQHAIVASVLLVSWVIGALWACDMDVLVLAPMVAWRIVCSCGLGALVLWRLGALVMPRNAGLT